MLSLNEISLTTSAQQQLQAWPICASWPEARSLLETNKHYKQIFTAAAGVPSITDMRKDWTTLPMHISCSSSGADHLVKSLVLGPWRQSRGAP